MSSLLRSHRVRNLPIDTQENSQSIIVRRKYILQDMMHHLKNHFDPSRYIKITFVGEAAVDRGGPLREFFNLVVKRVMRMNSIFCGPEESRCISHNIVELDKRTYYYVGQILGLSLVYGGPAPNFFAPSVALHIAFGDASSPSFHDIPDIEVKEKLMKVSYHYYYPPLHVYILPHSCS